MRGGKHEAESYESDSNLTGIDPLLAVASGSYAEVSRPVV
jgi:hypothetical protein